VWDREKIVLGAIREAKSHPNADRLVLAMGDYGGHELGQCVTGAPNLLEYKDKVQLGPPLPSTSAHEGAEGIGGHTEGGARMILKERALRGIPTRSMVMSEKELGLSDDHEGIMLLEWESYGHFSPGTPLQDVLGDAVLEIDMLPNIARAYSIVGVAREVAALTGAPLRYPPLDVVAEGESIEGQVRIEIREPELNPRFTLALIRDVEIKPSPQWMQRRLKLAGMRPINNMVDATNYVMLELGQPLHAFDYDVLVERAGGDAPTIITRLPEPGERLTGLDGVGLRLAEFTVHLAAAERALSIGGLMGGLESEVRHGTENVREAPGIPLSEDDERENILRGKASARGPVTQNVL